MGFRRVPEDDRRAVLALLAAGHNGMEVAGLTGVSKSQVYRLIQQAGGVFRPVDDVDSSRYLSREDRYEIARMSEGGVGVRAIARRLGRSASTVSRELRRVLPGPGVGYQPERAHTQAGQLKRRPKPSKLSGHPRLRRWVQDHLAQGWSPEQIAGRLVRDFPQDESMRVSHETIYQSLYVYPRGGLQRELVAHLRRGHTVRRRRGRRQHERIVGAVSIAQRPAEVQGRQVPGHHEGDLIMGSIASRSAVATIVERVSGYLTLVHLPDGYGADALAEALSTRLATYPQQMLKTLTWDRGCEMARHAQVSARTGLDIYFADPYSPWQRGSNENVNGLCRQYLPKSSDLSVFTAEDLTQIEHTLNTRPRKRLDFMTPAEKFAELLANDSVATTP